MLLAAHTAATAASSYHQSDSLYAQPFLVARAIDLCWEPSLHRAEADHASRPLAVGMTH